MKLVAELNSEFDVFLPKKVYEEVVSKDEVTFETFKKFANEGEMQYIGSVQNHYQLKHYDILLYASHPQK